MSVDRYLFGFVRAGGILAFPVEAYSRNGWNHFHLETIMRRTLHVNNSTDRELALSRPCERDLGQRDSPDVFVRLQSNYADSTGLRRSNLSDPYHTKSRCPPMTCHPDCFARTCQFSYPFQAGPVSANIHRIRTSGERMPIAIQSSDIDPNIFEDSGFPTVEPPEGGS